MGLLFHWNNYLTIIQCQVFLHITISEIINFNESTLWIKIVLKVSHIEPNNDNENKIETQNMTYSFYITINTNIIINNILNIFVHASV